MKGKHRLTGFEHGRLAFELEFQISGPLGRQRA